MPIDEFGREIPAASTRLDAPLNASRHGNGNKQPPTPRKPQFRHETSTSSSPRRKHPPQHPSTKYVSTPLLCQYVWKEQQQDKEESYDAYRKSYCLNYVRSFFNQHLDDSWFRKLYSPYEKYEMMIQQQKLSIAEAQHIQTAIRDDPEAFKSQVRLTEGNALPQSHLFSFQTNHKIFQILDIPPHLTDEQLRSALKTDFFTTSSLPKNGPKALLRSVIVISDTIRDEALSFECSSDPYNRLELENDGEEATNLQVVQYNLPIVQIVPRSVTLSSNLSSSTRFESDLEKALKLASRLDEQLKNLTEGGRLADFLPNDWEKMDQLDTAIAYLRRVHLVNFYHFCSTGTVADLILSNLHVRTTDEPEVYDRDDLLVQRLDQALEENVNKEFGHCIDPEVQAQAMKIRDSMEIAKQQWIQDHSISDTKGRARCSFHFCRKLFQDTSFLYKHLLKKHKEFLDAEVAKSHDESMMQAWDQETARPVPDLLVDCGGRFGTVPTPLFRQIEPDCMDPEPDLWKEQEEKQRPKREASKMQQQPRPRPIESFVDVDDMKEQKVDLSFEDVVPDVTKPKKKKKRKLL